MGTRQVPTSVKYNYSNQQDGTVFSKVTLS